MRVKREGFYAVSNCTVRFNINLAFEEVLIVFRTRKTLVNDVLLATNSHPDMQGLNHHLLPLANHFSNVNEEIDLSTIRWDLIGRPVGLAGAVYNKPVAMSPTPQEHFPPAHNLAVRSPRKHDQGGLSEGFYGEASRNSNTVLTQYRYRQPDNGNFKRALGPTGGSGLGSGLGLPIQHSRERSAM